MPSSGSGPKPDDRKKQKGEEGEARRRGTAKEESAIPKARTRRGGRHRQQKERKLGVKDAGLKELLTTISMLLAQVAQRGRIMWGVLMTTVIIDSVSKVAQSMQSEGEAFSKGASALREDFKKLKE